jgi:hypothetical protein
MYIYIYIYMYMYMYIYMYRCRYVLVSIYGGVRHAGCKGLNPLGLTRGVRASLMHEGFPHSLFNVVCSGAPAPAGKLMHRCASSGSTEEVGCGMMEEFVFAQTAFTKSVHEGSPHNT